MEGRTIVRPDVVRGHDVGHVYRPSMEGRTIVRPDDADDYAYRAGYWPSMEGRTIVRPDVVRGHDVGHVYRPSMEGRTIVRPDPHTLRSSRIRVNAPSMEGRTIVRPDCVGHIGEGYKMLTFNGGPDNRPARRDRYVVAVEAEIAPFNGGPDNRPARLITDASDEGAASVLQWRAGQSSGQTVSSRPASSIRGILQWRAGQSSGQTIIKLSQ